MAVSSPFSEESVELVNSSTEITVDVTLPYNERTIHLFVAPGERVAVPAALANRRPSSSRNKDYPSILELRAPHLVRPEKLEAARKARADSAAREAAALEVQAKTPPPKR